MNKIISAIIIVTAIATGGYLWMKKNNSSLPAATQPATTTQTSVAPEILQMNQNIVTYGDSGYSPSELRIKVGDTVIFKNSSSNSMWTASAVHPTHIVYPTTGGCLGSTFDACIGVKPGDSWSFKFDIAGSWKYHDHLNPAYRGTIVVEPN